MCLAAAHPDPETPDGTPIAFLNPNVAKAGGLQSQGAKGDAVVDLLRALGNAGSGVLRLSRRVKKMEKHERFLEWTEGLVQLPEPNLP